MADANDVSFNFLPDEGRPYNSNWDKTLKETFRATERDNQGWSDLGATELQARENGRRNARNGPDLNDQGSSRSHSREIERGVTIEKGPSGTDDDHNPYGFLSLGATKAQPTGMRADNQALDKLRASRRQPDLQSPNRLEDLRASRQAGFGRASRKDNLRETDSETSGPSVDRKSQGRSNISASGNNVASSGRGLRRTEIEPMRQTVLSTVTERTEDDVIRRTRESALPARGPDNPDWKTMIVEENYLWDWKNMFNKVCPYLKYFKYCNYKHTYISKERYIYINNEQTNI
ncbi:hypothetical protein DPMN_138653 [Dreissena polymorpha]|uniref:Uncharacterized protein n=1 Tax=Dreissena polymorpha TaxID=45954 RepID=A0A9D4G4B9_DREPO|nr:hypothetical protein DPMN_138653 [Dreissena polymorpha]